MEENGNSANQRDFPKILQIEFLRGITHAIPFVYLIFLMPFFVDEFFQIGLEQENLIIVIISVVLIFPSLLFIYLKPQVQYWINLGTAIAAGAFAMFVGVLVQCGVDGKNIAQIIVFAFFLLTSSIAAYLDIVSSWLSVKKVSNDADLFGYFLGLGTAISIIGILELMNQSLNWVLFGIGILYFIQPLNIFFKKEIAYPNLKTFTKPEIKGHHFQLFADSIVMIFIVLLSSMAGFVYSAPTIGWVFLGISIGMVANRLFAFKPGIVVIGVILIGLVLIYIGIYLSASVIQSAPVLLGLGGLLGLCAVDFILGLQNFPTQRRAGFIGWFIFIFLLIIIAGLGAYEFQRLIVNTPSLLWISFIVLGIVAIISLPLVKIGRTLSLLNPFQGITAVESWRISSKRITRGTVALSLCFLFIFPILINNVQSNVNASVLIALPTPMYLLNGTMVTSIDLNSESAQILTYTPYPSAPSQGELIRSGDSVRLGAYFYGLDNVSLNTAITWIGNNLDVYSLGMCGDTFSPDNISAIHDINLLVKFYYMAFATTLFEDPTNNMSVNGQWGDTHYPQMQFNDTMESWTVKLKNGSEALGVRRDSQTSTAHLMDLGNNGWADYFAWIYSQRAAEFHADGVAIDEVMWDGYWGTNVNDLLNYSSVNQITATCYTWLARLRSDTSMEIITQAFWPQALQYQNGIWGETSFSAGGEYANRVNDQNQTVWYYPNNWEGIVNTLVNVGEQNGSYIWAAWYDRGDENALTYAVATYLMGKPNNDTKITLALQPIFNGGYPANLAGYSVQNIMAEVNAHPELFNLQLGAAKGAMYQIQGVGGSAWERDFANGIVFVNPYHTHVPGF